METRHNEKILNNLFDGFERKIGVVSHPKFNHRKPHKWVDTYLVFLKELYDEKTNDELVYCIGDNNFGFDFYIKTNWKRLNLKSPPIISYDLGGSKNNLSTIKKKKQMYMKLIENTDGIIYLKHPTDPQINTFGSVIEKKCEKVGKVFLDIPLLENQIQTKEGGGDLCDDILKTWKKLVQK
jgi:hypothetical protein